MGRHWLKKALAAAVGGALLAPGALLGATEGPVAQLVVAPERPAATEPVTLDAGASNGANLTFRWDLDGDGTFETDGGTQPVASAKLEPGDHRVGVQVTDDRGATAVAMVGVTVAAAAEPEPTPPVEQEPTRPRQRTRGAAAEPVVRAAASSGVAIENFLYAPATIEVDVGDTVTWTNRDEEPHTATGNGGSFNTGNLARGESGSHTFSAAGRFPYICALHPSMRGTVVVAGASAGSPAGTADRSGSTAGGATPDSAGATLPETGAAVVIVALLGALLTGGGAALRRHAA